MPFVTKEHRDNPDMNVPGDRCFIWYRDMVREWREEPRWTTADRIYTNVLKPEAVGRQQVAKELAWQVFFQLHVMPYELKKRAENGEIE